MKRTTKVCIGCRMATVVVAVREFRNWPALLLAIVTFGPVNLGRSQEYVFSTLAGAGGGPGAIDGTGTTARFNSPSGVAVDNAGNLYVADLLNHTIRKVTPAGVVTTLAGLAGSPGSVNSKGSAARFNQPRGLALDSAGNLYLADEINQTIRKITPSGVVTTLAGSAGQSGSADGAANAARFNYPEGLAIDAATNLYVADQANSMIRKITPGGVVTTLAGAAGQTGSADGTGSAARFNYPSGVAVDGAGTVYVADEFNHTIRKITPQRVVTTLAGNPTLTDQYGNPMGGYADGTGSGAQFNYPVGVAVDSAGNVYVGDSSNHKIRKVTPDGVVTTLAGDPNLINRSTGSPVGGYADGTGSGARFNSPTFLAVDSAGRLHVADGDNNAIRQVTPDGVVTTLAGSGSSGSTDGPGTAARFWFPRGLAADNAGNLYVPEANNRTVRRVASGGMVTTLAGSTEQRGSDDGTGSAARFHNPIGVAFDGVGHLYVSDDFNHTIRRVTLDGVVTTLAGLAGSPGSVDGTGSAARFNVPLGVAADSAGNAYVADNGSHIIRKVTPDGVVTTLAGLADSPGSTDGTGGAARFHSPNGVAVDGTGNVYVADQWNSTIRKITPEGVVTTLAGSTGTFGSADGFRSAAQFNNPWGVSADGAGNVYVADSYNHTIRKITPSGWVTTLGGLAENAGSNDGVGSFARFNYPAAVLPDSAGNLYVADCFNDSIRFGTTNICWDLPTIDRASGPAGQTRQLDTRPQTALGWQWRVIRRPVNSVAELSAANVRNPTFTPDVADLFIFELRATNASGGVCVRTLNLVATVAPPPSFVASSLGLANGQFSFTIQSLSGNAVEILTSTDLVNWTSLATRTNLTGTLPFTDPTTSLAHRFYRLRQL